MFLLTILMCLPGWAGSAPGARHNRNNPVSDKLLARMMIPGTQDLQLIIELSDPGVVEKMRATSTPLGGTASLAERNRRIDFQSPQALAYRQQVVQNKEAIKTRILRFSGAQVLGTTEVVMNAVFVRVHASDYRATQQLPGVKKVYFSRKQHLLLDQAAVLQNAQALWTAAGGQANAGKGERIGLIDTGIDITNPMFSGSGMTAPSGFPKSDTSADMAYTNSKVIVARNYVTTGNGYSAQTVQTAVDEVGHGTFVAGCAAGQSVSAPLTSTQIAGMAPGAYLGSYKVFGTPGINDGATTTGILAALDDAILDGMEVVSLSLGGLDYVPPADDAESIALENAIKGGVVVTLAAGNDGNGTHTIDSPGTTDDAITVGSVSDSHALLGTITTPDPSLSTIAYSPSGDGISVSSTLSAKVIDVQSLDGTGLGCSAFASGSLSGSIALIERGTCYFSVKAGNAAAAGAVAVIVYNNVSPGLVSMDGLSSVSIPAVAISQSDGATLKQYVDSHSGTQVSIGSSITLQSVPTARIVSNFSSVGPNMDFTIKPDMVAVGENVYSAVPKSTSATLYDPTGYAVASGTSFSTPMVAGAAAALRQHFPNLGPLAIKSLLTTTASRNVTVDGTTAAGVLQAGSGLLNMGNAFAATAVFSPTSMSFGVHSYSGSFSSLLPLAINNISSTSDQFTLGVEQIVSGASITFSQNTVSIGPGATASINVLISVTAPNSGGFQGFVTVKSSNTSFVYRIPFWAGVYIPDTSTVVKVSQSSSGSGTYSDLATALAAAQPGNIIQIQDSATYSIGPSGLVISTNSQGVPLHGITIQAATGQTPVLDGTANLASADYPADIDVVGLQNVLFKGPGLTINGGYVGIELLQPDTSLPLSVTIDQTTISNSGGVYDPNGIWPEPVGIWIDQGGTIDVTNSNINNSGGAGIVAGAYGDGTQLTVLNSTLQGNADNALYAFGSNVDLFNSSFTASSGAGAYLDYCSGTVKGNTFAQNQGVISGGQYYSGDGLQVADGNVLVQKNLFDSNTDAGVALNPGDQTGFGPTVQVLGNTMHNNGSYGSYLNSYPYGIVSNAAVSVVADGNLIDDNWGGIDLYGTSSALLTNNIIVRSTDSTYGTGDGIFVEGGSNASIINNTIYANGQYGVDFAGGTVAVANSIVYGNKLGNLYGVFSNSTLLTSADPMFNNPSANDFSLKAGSPAIDKGTNALSSGLSLPFLDYSGRLRVASATGLPGQGTVDIGALEANSQYPLVYPLAANGTVPSLGGSFQTGIALLNPNSSAANISLTAYSGSGSLLTGAGFTNPYSQALNVENQYASLYYQTFGFGQTVSELGSLLAASNIKPVGFSLIFDPAFRLFSTGANATPQTGMDLVFMRHEYDANGATNYVIANPGVNTANVTATLYDATGGSHGQQTSTIAPKGQTVLNFNSSNLSSGFVNIASNQPVSGIELVGNSSRQAALSAFSPGTEARIFFPHYTVGGGYTTHVGTVNSSASVANLTITAYDNNGNILGTPYSVQLAAGGQFLGSVSDLFGISTAGAIQTGYLVAQSNQPGIMGYTDFTYNDGIHNADANVPADSVPSTKLLFAHVANGIPTGTGSPELTGIALLNPYGTQVPYTITVYDDNGNQVAQASYTLGPHQKIGKLLSYPDPTLTAAFFTQPIILGGGHIEVTSTYGLIGLELFLAQDVSQLTSVPAQTQ
jgi:minor extracellular serine protease Vpr